MKKSNSLYIIRKHADCWTINNTVTCDTRKLTNEEVEALQEEFPALQDPLTLSLSADSIKSLDIQPEPVRPHRGKRRRIR
jgi:hypothetical protein